MKIYKNIIISTFFGFLLLILPASLLAADPDASFRFVCLNMTWCAENPQACSPTAGDGTGGTYSKWHRAILQTRADIKGIPNDPKAYLTECIEIDTDGNKVPEIYCTTGNSTLDKELFCPAGGTGPECDVYSHLRNLTVNGEKVGYDITTGMYGVYYFENGKPVKKTPTYVATDNLGNLVPSKMEWQSYTKAALTRKFFLWNKVAVEGNATGGLGGLQQADLTVAFNNSECTGKKWDPMGRLFDTKTLEPIPGSKVTLKQYNPGTKLMEEGYASAQNPGIFNPQPIGSDGRFSFYVIDGDYALAPMKTGYTHAALSMAATLNPNTSKIYTNYYYSDSDPIKQRGTIQLRDIPMVPANGVGMKYPLTILSMSQTKSGATLIFEGEVSHPYAKAAAKVCRMENNAETCGVEQVFTSLNGGPNKDGDYKLSLDQSKLKSGDYYRVYFTPKDLTVSGLSWVDRLSKEFLELLTGIPVGQVYAQDADTSLSLTLEPVPSYLEGYAYDAQGKIMSNALVGIYVPFSQNPTYSMRTDANGYYKITSEYLPTTAYVVKYSGAGDNGPVATLTTSQFLAQNAGFIEAEKVNPYSTVTKNTDPRRTVTPSYMPQQTVSIVPSTVVPSQAPSVVPPPANPPVTQNPVFLVGAVLLLLIATSGTLLAVYLYRKKMHENTEMKP